MIREYDPSMTRALKAALLISAAAVGMAVTAQPAAASEFRIIHSFSGADGRYPGGETPLTVGPLGAVAGVTQLGGREDSGVLFVIGPKGDFHVIHHFTSGSAGGVLPTSVKFAPLGWLYGTTAFGGEHGAGAFFVASPLGGLKTIHSFNYVTGNQPSGRTLYQGGYFYGSTGFGGDYGAGNVYQLSPAGDIQTLYSAPALFSNDAGMYSGLVGDLGGNFYGATMGYDVGDYHGVLFKIEPSGARSILHTFEGGSDGSRPTSAPAVAADGAVYGATYQGGANNSGTIYRVTASGEYSVLYSFDGETAGGPFGGLIVGKNGKLYGTSTIANGAIYEFDPGIGELRVIHVFADDATYPQGGLVEAAAGTFYGTTGAGGLYGMGTVYKFIL